MSTASNHRSDLSERVSPTFVVMADEFAKWLRSWSLRNARQSMSRYERHHFRSNTGRVRSSFCVKR